MVIPALFKCQQINLSSFDKIDEADNNDDLFSNKEGKKLMATSQELELTASMVALFLKRPLK